MNTSNSALADYPATMESANNYLHDYDEIIKTVQHYIDGSKAGKSELMRSAFHSEATIVGFFFGNRLIFNPIQKLFDLIDGNGPASNLQPYFASVEILETIAVVRLEVKGWTGNVIGSEPHDMSDLFNLIKTDSGWKISQKMFHLH
jgi:hypothetical protein